MSIDLSKKGKLETLTKYYMSFNADFYVYCEFTKDIQKTNDFGLKTKTDLAAMIRFCQRQFVDSMIVKLAKLTEATLKISKKKLSQINEDQKCQLIEKIYTLEGEYTKSSLKKIRDKIVAHLDDDFLNYKEKFISVSDNYKVAESEEYEKILALTGDLIKHLWIIQCNTTIVYPERSLNLANQLLSIMISGYKNFYCASKSIGKQIVEDEELENFTLNLEIRAEKLNPNSSPPSKT